MKWQNQDLTTLLKKATVLNRYCVAPCGLNFKKLEGYGKTGSDEDNTTNVKFSDHPFRNGDQCKRLKMINFSDSEFCHFIFRDVFFKLLQLLNGWSEKVAVVHILFVWSSFFPKKSFGDSQHWFENTHFWIAHFFSLSKTVKLLFLYFDFNLSINLLKVFFL